MADLGTVVDRVTVIPTPWVQDVNDTIYQALQAGKTPAAIRAALGLTATTGAGLVGSLPASTVQADLNARAPLIMSVAALRLLTTATFPATSVNLYSYYGTSVLGGGGTANVDATDITTADNGGTVIVDASGRRWKAQGEMNDARWGARGNGTADDTVRLQAYFDYAKTARVPVRLSAVAPNFYRTTATLTTDAALSIIGAGSGTSQIILEGASAGQYVIDYNCLAVDAVENVLIQGVTVRSNNAANAYGIRLKNVSYVETKDVRLYDLARGIVPEGTRCFTHSYDKINSVGIVESTIRFAAGFIGGGQFTYINGTFVGNVGFVVPSTAYIDGLNFVGCNFEQGVSRSLLINGTVAGLSINGGRTEGCDDVDFEFRPTLATEYVGGISIAGTIFSASDAAATTRISMGGSAGKVRGFSITGNTVTHGSNTYAGAFVTLNGDGESGLIAGNYLHGTTCTITNTQRAGVVVHSNENLSGKLPEYWGTATWGVAEGDFVPVDASGAGLTFTAASGRYTKIGRTVTWQASVTYPATANGADAAIGGLPFAVGALGGNAEGRSGAHVDVTNLGATAGLLHGVASTTSVSVYNPQTFTAITNATVSGKLFYISGSYTI